MMDTELVVVATARVMGMGPAVLGLMEHLRVEAQAELEMILAMMIKLAIWTRDTRPFFLERFLHRMELSDITPLIRPDVL